MHALFFTILIKESGSMNTRCGVDVSELSTLMQPSLQRDVRLGLAEYDDLKIVGHQVHNIFTNS